MERKNEPTIYETESSDNGMNKAREEAIKTLNQFHKAFESNNSKLNSFSIKQTFSNERYNEHIWLNGIFKKNGEYYGVVDNLPEYVKEVHLGDTVKIVNQKISDWMYLENSQLNGGFTIRELRNRMTEEERKKFDAESGMIIKP
ncbi:DUF2314 domain-containing protein [Flavobacterium aciduliphilum]|uniref:Uncharacterized protein YegJ (DUF2314 family) n=1 Tax=Flavobacterium aciduliphilum TaxID=1101402 RepID=A0A328YKF8_9FLAO|nr:DUF2314 domain-containing protein [Flavobacterium aciduliphilum]RAR70626.1 uncharacterized protein YegJ (DUF2314 family) [Flavobacterium aciduliphilum]